MDELNAGDLCGKEKVNLEAIDIDAFTPLQFGENALARISDLTTRLAQLLDSVQTLSWIMDGVALVNIFLFNCEGQPPLLLFINSAIDFYKELNASNAIKVIMDPLAPKATLNRDGPWSGTGSSNLVPGDVFGTDASIDQAALTSELLFQSNEEGDRYFSQGEVEGVVIPTGGNTFVDDCTTGYLQMTLARIGSFCLIAIGIFVIAKILALYAGFRYTYCRGLNNILILIGGIPTAIPTVLSITLAVGARQLGMHKAVVTCITAIELAGTDTLITNKLIINKSIAHTYGPFSTDNVALVAAYASRTGNQDSIGASVIQVFGDTTRARSGIKLLDLKPFSPVDKRTEVTYGEESSGKFKRVTKDIAGIIFEPCTHNKTDEFQNKLEADVEEFATRGLRALAVAYEELDGDDPEGEGDGFELIGLLAIFDLREETKQTIDDALLGVKVNMVTGDQLAITKEAGRRLGFGGYMHPAKMFKDGHAPGSKHMSLDAMILEVDGFIGRLQGFCPFCAMTDDGANDTPALPRVNVGIAAEGATDAARCATDITLTEPGLSTVVRALRGSRVIFQHMRNCSIYACTATIRIVVYFATLAFAFKFDFAPFLIIALNDDTIMALSVDCVLPSPAPDSWDLAETFAVALVAIILKTLFFYGKFSVTFDGSPTPSGANDYQLHSIAYLQVAIISQSLVFVTRSHGFFLSRSGPAPHPSVTLMVAFCIAQLVSSIISAYANCDFTQLRAASGGRIGVIWVWAAVIKKLRQRHEEAAKLATDEPGVSFALSPCRIEPVGFGSKVAMKHDEPQRFSSIRAQRTGQTLAYNPNRTT
ncbi:calcium ATPase transmembrane domain M-containing protein [Coniophora puteana RWD-64-598 SS2]|uniref:Calcium ATPase transmembrane domain M-containing protein n=1 Tax=Coniophora puteana (strain RWD-64-598) TaxID=741705 RepID=A0A5M3M7I5_CONPW|nr:calcium ATPase transmembrane domain M-containing protein [Coniophora puteana RWD-64-598 SS2]EIW74876.1 calcium ATPase transmembrane domain M-containing protein [Coniophora puteana RWD-64-598 SS2]